MSESKVSAAQLRRAAVVYVRQSTMAQLSRNRESTARQYDLVGRAVELGWPRAGVRVIDEDLGVSGASAAGRAGFAELAAQVGLGQVGIVLALEVSRLARNNADWYRLLDLAGMTDTLIADTDGVYHPGLFNDRMLLGMKGTMSEAELHILRARLHGGIRSKAARGQLRRASRRAQRAEQIADECRRQGGHDADEQCVHEAWPLPAFRATVLGASSQSSRSSGVSSQPCENHWSARSSSPR